MAMRPRIPAHQHVVEMAQVLIDPQIRQERDALEHPVIWRVECLADCAPQPALAVLAIGRTVQRRRPAFEKAGRYCGSDRLGRGGLEVRSIATATRLRMTRSCNDE